MFCKVCSVALYGFYRKIKGTKGWGKTKNMYSKITEKVGTSASWEESTKRDKLKNIKTLN